MSVNISRFDLLDDELPSFVATCSGDTAFRRGGSPWNHRVLPRGGARSGPSGSIEQLRELGVRISIDDFGVGYSSMSQLLELTIDELKIDQSFVLALRTDLRARAVISAALMFARALQLTVVAEGIETFPTLHVVQRLGVDVGQGFFISVPLAAAQLRDFLAVPPEILPPSRQQRMVSDQHEFARTLTGGTPEHAAPSRGA